VADDDHVALLRTGVGAWNADRPALPDLSRAKELRASDLQRVDLCRANLRGTNLRRAKLTKANLREADLRRTTLEGADLRGSNLRKADLRMANLAGADLHETDLREANLQEADLRGADLRGAFVRNADLSTADLRGANLSKADLDWSSLHQADVRDANLSDAFIRDADLSGADLREVRLRRSTLQKTDLRGADLRDADLRDADLRTADLHGADLRAVDLSRSNLTGANLAGARSGATSWTAVDLRDVSGLGSLVHAGPSSVGIDTLVLSGGTLDEAFLRGCGVDPPIAAALADTVATTTTAHFGAFISHNRADADLAAKLVEHLFVTHEARAWLDEHQLAGGEPVGQSLYRGVHKRNKVVLLCSEASLGSWWLEEAIDRWAVAERELRRTGTGNESLLIPVDLDGFVQRSDLPVATHIRTRPIVSAEGWADDPAVAARVLDEVEQALQREPSRRT